MFGVSYRYIGYLAIYIQAMTYISPIANVSMYRILTSIYVRCIGYLQYTRTGHCYARGAKESGLLCAQSEEKAVFRPLLNARSQKQRLLCAQSYGLLYARSYGDRYANIAVEEGA
jgi:hypothetical protein